MRVKAHSAACCSRDTRTPNYIVSQNVRLHSQGEWFARSKMLICSLVVLVNDGM